MGCCSGSAALGDGETLPSRANSSSQRSQFPWGSSVEAHSLASADFNGARGRVTGFQGERVRVDFGAPFGEKALKPANLRHVRDPRGQSSCPRCGAANEFAAAVAGMELPPAVAGMLRVQCGRCAHEFQAASSEPEAGLGMPRLCRGCGVMNRYPAFEPGRSQARMICGSCGTAEPDRLGLTDDLIAEMLLRGGTVGSAMDMRTMDMRSMDMRNGRMVHVNVGGRQHAVPLATLLSTLPTQAPDTSASRSDIRSLPTHKLGASDPRGEQARCMVCLEEYADGDTVKTMPCLHFFHQACIDRWLGTDNSCPVCKTRIGESGMV